jgi:hypothetical protein
LCLVAALFSMLKSHALTSAYFPARNAMNT